MWRKISLKVSSSDGEPLSDSDRSSSFGFDNSVEDADGQLLLDIQNWHRHSHCQSKLDDGCDDVVEDIRTLKLADLQETSRRRLTGWCPGIDHQDWFQTGELPLDCSVETALCFHVRPTLEMSVDIVLDWTKTILLMMTMMTSTGVDLKRDQSLTEPGDRSGKDDDDYALKKFVAVVVVAVVAQAQEVKSDVAVGVVGGVRGASLSDPGLDCGVVAVVALDETFDVVNGFAAEAFLEEAGLQLLLLLLLLLLLDLLRLGWYLYSGCSRLWRTRSLSASRWNGSFSSSFKILKNKKLLFINKSF